VVLDTITQVELLVDVFISDYYLLIVVYFLTSLIKVPYSLNPVQRFLRDVCEPYLRLWRRILPSFGPLDLSPIVAFFGLIVLREIVNNVLDRFH
jgi:YggT family protein